MIDQSHPAEAYDALRTENKRLLDELEDLYLRMEGQLLASERERDIAYQELAQRNRQLEERVAELERAHADLKSAQQMLVRSERLAAMGEMAAAIVHELKNPLTALLGRLELVDIRGGSAEREDLDVMARASNNMHRLIDSVLRFARQHRAEVGELDLNGLVQGMVAFVQPLAKSAKIELALADDGPQGIADAGQVEQVLLNLILNALDATEKRGHIRMVTGTGTPAEGVTKIQAAGWPCQMALEAHDDFLTRRCVFIDVQDNGPGIEPAHMGRIFDTFFTTKAEGKGTGLGLSIVRTIVEGWGGNILRASQVDVGTRFRVFLPCAD